MSALDLSGADTSGITPMPSGKYPLRVYAAEMTETKGGPNAKLPTGTPMLKIQYAVLEPEEYSNRYVFGNYPTEFPDDYPKDKLAKMLGNLANLFIALGYDEKAVMGGKFKLDADDLLGRECDGIVAIGKDQNGEPNNNLKSVKLPGSGGASASSGVM